MLGGSSIRTRCSPLVHLLASLPWLLDETDVEPGPGRTVLPLIRHPPHTPDNRLPVAGGPGGVGVTPVAASFS